MTTGQDFGESWSSGARDWAQFVESRHQTLYESVFERLGVGTGTRLLDIGCGPGGAALLAAGRGAEVAGLDAAPGSIAVARERVPVGDFRVGDMEKLPWADGAFDVVTGFNSFPFAVNTVAALAEARRVLAPSGKLGVVVLLPRADNQQIRVMAAIGAVAPPHPQDGPGPFALSGPGAVESALQSAGMRLLEISAFPMNLTFTTAEEATRAFLAGGPGAQAVQQNGEDHVRQSVEKALQEFQLDTGGYQLQNWFRVVIAE